MPVQHQLQPADDISDKDVIGSWDQAADEFAGFFSEGDEFYHKHIITPCLMDLLGDLEGKMVLDLGCGEGHLARYLAEGTRSTKVLGLDASENMIRIAAEKSQDFADRLAFQQADASDLAGIPSGFFDVAVCNMALMDIKNYSQAIKEVSRTLKAQGVFVFSILHPCFHTPGSGWVKDQDDAIVGWQVGSYYSGLAWKWTPKSRMSKEAYCFHRTLQDYATALRGAGFVITDIREPIPSAELLEKHPRLDRELIRGDFLVVKCVLLSVVSCSAITCL